VKSTSERFCVSAGAALLLALGAAGVFCCAKTLAGNTNVNAVAKTSKFLLVFKILRDTRMT